MNPWREVVSAVSAELERLGQEVGGRVVIPNAIGVSLPAADFARFVPVLAEVTAEVGKALLAWATAKRHGWYRDLGPFVRLEIREVARVEVVCEFVREAPAG